MIDGNPFELRVARALRSHDDTIVTLERHIYELVFPMKYPYLEFVIRAAFTMSVQEKEHRIFFFAFCIIRRGIIISVGHGKDSARFLIRIFIYGSSHYIYINSHLHFPPKRHVRFIFIIMSGTHQPLEL